ncbi:uncharacterized protein G2W53_004845 [Senna tora]|uniref:Uncharacterized protein n=1 Tax=Senna tora TaxID=362788 RepID=A0A834XCW4_9FABA|nr:uncharacterized protein G2W53_004845 [Senna tora]
MSLTSKGIKWGLKLYNQVRILKVEICNDSHHLRVARSCFAADLCGISFPRTVNANVEF